MPPRSRSRRIVVSPASDPSLPSEPPSEPADTQPSDLERFDIDNVSGSDDGNIEVNNPDVPKLSGNIAKDIDFFFDKTSNNIICKLCRYICSLCNELFGF